jgi:hypothetical protein
VLHADLCMLQSFPGTSHACIAVLGFLCSLLLLLRLRCTLCGCALAFATCRWRLEPLAPLHRAQHSRIGVHNHCCSYPSLSHVVLQIQEAYDTLSDPAKRREYDSVDEFDDTLPLDCKPTDFFKVCRGYSTSK